MPTDGYENRSSNPAEIVGGLVHEFMEMLGDGEATGTYFNLENETQRTYKIRSCTSH